MEPNKIKELEERITKLELLLNKTNQADQINPDILNAIIVKSSSTPSAGYDGRFKINGKLVDYKNP